MFEAALVCLAMNIYHEAKNQPQVGQIAVAQVVMNRVMDSRYPDDVCSVVTQGQTYSWNPSQPIRHKCQFSWYCDGKSDQPKDGEAWQNAMLLAGGVLLGRIDDMVQGSTHYHATYVQPDWAQSKTYVVRIEDHIFYRWEK